MADEISRTDGNNRGTLVALTTAASPEVRNLRTDSNGILLVSASTSASGATTATIAPSTAAAITTVALSTATATVLAANTNRKGAYVVNESTSPGIALIALATAATLTAYSVPIAVGGFWEMPIPAYTGALSGITASTSATLRVTELT